MNLQEHDDNNYTKQQSDVESYLKRVIQRYFELENNYTETKIEAIIVESITRLKRELLDEKGYIFALNNKTGHITLNIQDIGGESAFGKNNAFNKEFCPDGIDTPDTIAMGNDIRLDDDREPIQHNHLITDINKLRKTLDEILLSFHDGTHYHNNKSLLDMLKYSGTLAEIDLVIIEEFRKGVSQCEADLKFQNQTVISLYKLNEEKIDNALSIIKNKLDYIQSMVSASVTWFSDIQKYIDTSRDTYISTITKELNKLLSKSTVETVLAKIKELPICIDSGEFPIDAPLDVNIEPTIEKTIQVRNILQGSSLRTVYNNGITIGRNDDSGTYRWIWDNSLQSFVYKANIYSGEGNYPRFISDAFFQDYTHRVQLMSSDNDDDTLSVVLAYDPVTQNTLSLLCTMGGDSYSGGNCAIRLNTDSNFPGTDLWHANPFPSIYSSDNGWAAATQGICVLVKKSGNKFKIWTKFNSYDSTSDWLPNEDGDIPETSTPLVEFDMSLYPQLSMFLDKKVGYGYGTNSQADSYYQNVYICGDSIAIDYDIGHTTFQDIHHFEHTFKNIDKYDNIRCKLYFRYTNEHGDIVDEPLPLVFFNRKESCYVKAEYTNNTLYIDTFTYNECPVCITAANVYNNRYLFADYQTQNGLWPLTDYMYNNNIHFPVIDSEELNNFISSLCLPNIPYYINGTYQSGNSNSNIRYAKIDIETRNSNDTLHYYHWPSSVDFSEKETLMLAEAEGGIVISNGEWYPECNLVVHPYIGEFIPKALKDYYACPKIYYQIFGTLK